MTITTASSPASRLQPTSLKPATRTRSVLVITVVHNPLDSRIWSRQVDALLQSGWHVTYVAPFSGYNQSPPVRDAGLPGSLTCLDIPRAKGLRRSHADKAARNLLKRLARHHNLVVVHDPELLMAAAGLRLDNLVWDIHEDTAAALKVKEWMPKTLRPTAAKLWRRAKRHAERTQNLLLKQSDKRRVQLMIDVPRGPRQRIDVDVCIFTTLRFPGGNASSTMAEVAAFTKHGLSVRLIHIPVTMSARMSARYAPFLPLVVHCDDVDEITCRLAIVRAPRVIIKTRFYLLARRVTADRGVFVVNNSFRRPSGESVFDYDDLTEVVARVPWPKKEIYPIGPAIRAEMVANGTRLRDQMPPFDWTPTLDASAIAFAPPEQLGRPLTIGRHARDGSEKWPSRHEDLLAAYPDSESFRVLILGGAAEPSSTFGGHLPSNWTVIPFGHMSPTDYLRQLDVFVYFPHPDLNEAFGRTILEAMFAGVPCVLPQRFSETFGDLALFCDPADVCGVLSRLAADDTGRLRFVRWVRSHVDNHFETTALLRRIPEFGLVDQRVAMSIDCPPDIAAFRLRVAPTPQLEHQQADPHDRTRSDGQEGRRGVHAAPCDPMSGAGSSVQARLDACLG